MKHYDTFYIAKTISDYGDSIVYESGAKRETTVIESDFLKELATSVLFTINNRVDDGMDVKTLSAVARSLIDAAVLLARLRIYCSIRRTVRDPLIEYINEFWPELNKED